MHISLAHTQWLLFSVVTPLSTLTDAALLSPFSPPAGSSGASRNNSSQLETPRTNSAYMGPPPCSPGRKSTLLAICRQLPPSMQRSEWCLDDYIITDKLYKGYASMGESRNCGVCCWVTAFEGLG